MTDQEKIRQAVRLFLEGIGENPEREGLKDTPDRIARMCSELFGGMDEDAGVHLARTFSADKSEMVLEKDITFYSMCEHHALPFYGKAHIAYIPDGKVVGLSKLARTVEVFARRLQIQEQLTGQIADALMEYMQPKGAIVMLEAEHMCMTMRGIKKPGSRTVTLARRGLFEEIRHWRSGFSGCWEDRKQRTDPVLGGKEGRETKSTGHAAGGKQMDRVNAVREHPLYREYYERLEKLEEGRIFCRHQMPHLLDVARIAYIRNLEEGLGFPRDVIYTAAVLHDIGKSFQYEKKIPHEIAGTEIAEKILSGLPGEFSFTETEKRQILTAIKGHRRLREDAEPLERLLYESDKASRMCFACPAEKQCDWSKEKKNLEIKV